MSGKEAQKKILIQLDPDRHASAFDAVVAVDSGVDQLLPYPMVEPSDVRDLVYGAIFTRAPEDLSRTAIFVGGTDVQRAEELVRQVQKAFFGPMRVSVMMDANGANTTAAAAVVAARRHVDLKGATATVLAATGPVGQRVVRLLAGDGCHVKVASRNLARAESVGRRVVEHLEKDNISQPGEIQPIEVATPDDTLAAVADSQIVVAAGAAGVCLLTTADRQQCHLLRVAIDLNAVPPLGIEGTAVSDKAAEHDGVLCYGAVGVGGTKMKIHRAAVQALFTSNQLVLDAQEIYQIGCDLENAPRG